MEKQFIGKFQAKNPQKRLKYILKESCGKVPIPQKVVRKVVKGKIVLIQDVKHKQILLKALERRK